MIVREFQVVGFRNIALAKAEFAPGLNLLHGANGQGKTNLLEALHMLVTGRSFRTVDEKETLPWAREPGGRTLVRARVETRLGEDRFMLGYDGAGKRIAVNGEPVRRLGDLVGRLNAVLFTPHDLNLVRGGPGGRRRFLDLALSQVSRTYFHHLQCYDQALRQRNALLKQAARRPSARTEMEAWNPALAEHGGALHAARADAVARLDGLARVAYANIAGEGAEALSLAYRPHPQAVRGVEPSASEVSDTAADASGRIAAALVASAADDLRHGATQAGPHRDDMAFLLDNRDARAFASQGQQRSCVLALKMAELRFMTDTVGESPVLMLDDLMSELDQRRRAALLAALGPVSQVFVTATDRGAVTDLARPTASFAVRGGELAADG